jgi:hypothetical protein
MPSRPEPHQDQRTISSFKRTFNAALLLRAARPSVELPARASRRPLLIGAALILGPALLGDLQHLFSLAA